MKETFLNIKNKISKTFGSARVKVPEEQEYVEVGPEAGEKPKVIVRPFVLEDFADVKAVLDDLREGYTIALVNIKPLKEKDLIELKRAINKIKKTCDAIEGDIAGFGDDYIVVVPSFAKIHRSSQTPSVKADEDPEE
jgi:SepF-like predicted cell division protein (DUF552 family)